MSLAVRLWTPLKPADLLVAKGYVLLLPILKPFRSDEMKIRIPLLAEFLSCFCSNNSTVSKRSWRLSAVKGVKIYAYSRLKYPRTIGINACAGVT